MKTNNQYINLVPPSPFPNQCMPYILKSPPPHNYECTSSISYRKQAKVLENEKHLPLPNNLKSVLCIHVLMPTIITIIIHTKQQMKIT